ncbi:response regulator FixJ [Stakelama sediminis]|uniref:Two-component system response regulator FixJ n=1 Tax=Stakelama sediminis TaxID=463200 RepID=A0A840YU55_9SPHN|nr:response regulator [Stakelama sediminis]MBB5717107.1 two-component system response regulator FixJ [Stakelama sediminis]
MSRFVYIVDDEAPVRDSLRALLSTRNNLHLVPCVSGDAFLADIKEREPGVVLLDIHMPGRSGIDVLREIQDLSDRFCTVMLTGQGDIQLAVQAMKLGAVDFLEKPYDHRRLFGAIDAAFEQLDQSAEANQRSIEARQRLELLSGREREVLDLMVDGEPNKRIAAELGISIRTVEVHRSNAMSKLSASSLAEAVRTVFTARPGRILT